MHFNETDIETRRSTVRCHGICIHRLSPPILLQKEEDGCALHFPAAVYLRNEAIRQHLSALFTAADSVSMESDGSKIVLTFRVRETELVVE